MQACRASPPRVRTCRAGYDGVQAWLAKYSEAALAVSARAARLEAVAEEIEVELEVLGATAIEDKLQVGATAQRCGLRIACCSAAHCVLQRCALCVAFRTLCCNAAHLPCCVSEHARCIGGCVTLHI